ncbi:hypothetical protein CHS0354_031004, partial [Potamilus streckersoni]
MVSELTFLSCIFEYYYKETDEEIGKLFYYSKTAAKNEEAKTIEIYQPFKKTDITKYKRTQFGRIGVGVVITVTMCSNEVQ